MVVLDGLARKSTGMHCKDWTIVIMIVVLYKACHLFIILPTSILI